MAERIGGSFAPPLSDELLAKYKGMIDGLAASPVKDAMAACLACCLKWWDLPESSGTGILHAADSSGKMTIISLDKPNSQALWDLIPWQHEIDAIQSLFNAIPLSDRDLRNAAFHLLWHVKELNLDREPLTNDKLVKA